MRAVAPNSRSNRSDGREHDAEVAAKADAALARKPKIPGKGTRVEMELDTAEPGRVIDASSTRAGVTAGDRNAVGPNKQRMGDLLWLRVALRSMDGVGAPLPDGVSAKMSRLLDADLSAVRVHTAGAASDAAAKMGARAFTHHNHIAFAPGTYEPGSAATQHVLAHELVHVIQNQRAGGQAMQLAARLDVGPSGSDVEREAEAGAHAVAAGQRFAIASRSALPAISMFAGSEPVPTTAPVTPATPNPNAAPQTAATPKTPPQNQQAAAPQVASPTPTSVSAPPAAAPAPQKTPPAPAANGPSPAPANANTTATPSPHPQVGASPTPGKAPPEGAGAEGDALAHLDKRIAAILEQRADPKLKADYAKGVGQLQVLRVQALQYGFQKSGFLNTLFQTIVFPTESVSAHWGQIYSQNVYRTGQGLFSLDGLQATIEGIRGGLHILGDLASIISAWAGIVSIISAAIALIGVETGVIAVIGAAIAAIADAVSIISGLIKILLDCLDMILGVLQMLILVIRARSSKDPNARARFAQLLHKEAGDLSTNIMGVATQVAVLFVTAGVGAGLSTGIAKGFGKITAHDFGTAFGEEFSKLVNPKVVFKGGLDGVVEKFSTSPVGKGVKSPLGDRIVNAAGEDALRLSVLRRAANGRVTKERQLVKFTSANQMNGARLARSNEALGKIFAMDGAAVPGFGLHVQSIMVAAKAPDPSSFAKPSTGQNAGTTPESPGSGGAAGPLSTVAMWPSQIDAFTRAKAPLPGAKEYIEDQLKNAKEQAGPELAAKVDAKLKEVAARSAKSKDVAKSVGADAQEGQAASERGAQTAGKGAAAKTKADGTKDQMDAQTKKAEGAGQGMKPPPPKDNLTGWLYNHTIGYLGSLIGKVQNWLKDMIGKFVMWAAGFTKEDLDLAGIENDMRTDAQKDTASEQAAKDAADKDDPVQKAVFELMKDKNTSQQQAIQGITEAQSFLTALEQADETMDEAIKNGNVYIQQAVPIIQHELDTQTQSKAIDSAYIAPLSGYADTFLSSITADTLGAQAQAQANGELAQMKALFPALDIASGNTRVTTIVTGYSTARAQLVNQAKGGAEKMKTTLSTFVGTTDYNGVNANAAALDDMLGKFYDEDGQLGDELYKDLNALMIAYITAINKAESAAGADNAGAPQEMSPTSGTPPPSGTSGGTPPPSGSVPPTSGGAPPASGGAPPATPATN